MFLFICTAVLAALFLGVKLTKDIFPKPLKRWLCKKAISNWMKGQPQKFGKKASQNPKSYAETGLLPSSLDVVVERPLQITNPALRDEYMIYGSDEKRNGLSVKITRFQNDQICADILLTLDDSKYQMSYQGKALTPHEFSIGNLKVEMVDPFRTWRVWYNGIMVCSPRQKNGEKQLVHVVFNFLWKALGSPSDNRKNGNATLLASHLSSIGLFGENLPSLFKILPEGFSQMGTLHGQLQINGQHQYSVESGVAPEDQELYLFGFRTREILAESSDTFPLSDKSGTEMRDTEERLELFAMCDESGHGFRLTAYDGKWTDGRMLWASYETTLITDIDCTPSQLLHRNNGFTKLFNVYDAKGTSRVEIWSEEETHQLSNDESQITYLKMAINGRNANGVLIRKAVQPMRGSVSDRGCSSQCCGIDNDNGDGDHYNCTNCQNNDDDGSGSKKYILEFSDPACAKVPLVGGKGASLSRLQRFAMQKSNKTVKTARGFCVTTNLFRDLLDLEKFAHVFNNASGNDQSLEARCTEVMKMIKSSDAENKLSTLISPRIEAIFGENRNKIRFAVRSSGVLEDGSDLSSAGQNETFLGVSQDLISRKVVECWASLFTSQSVQYRLNHGQPAVSEMSVVVQEMVDARSAGVIFTADPRTGNPFQMFITANYGLGESVVSGSCDPDFITLIRHAKSQIALEEEHNAKENCESGFSSGYIQTALLRRSKWWRDVTIGKKVLGGKRTKIICTSKETEEISMTDQESGQFCLDEDMAIKLGAVAGEIELFMGHHKPVDIEWAIDQNGTMFILQCRNLTALDAWTDFEILHELDAAMRTKRERFTTANTGEVLPKALYTITTTMNRCLEFAIQQNIYVRKGDPFPLTPYVNITCPLFQQRLFINMMQTLYVNAEKEISTAMVCLDQTVFGRQVTTEEIRKCSEERFGLASGMSKLNDFIVQMKHFWTFKSITEKEHKKYRNFKLDYSRLPQTAVAIYQQISIDLFHLYNTAMTHMVTTTSSSGSQFFLFLFLSEGKPVSEWSSSLYEDASKLLSVFENVESAEMPEDMDRLIDEIIKHGGDERQITKEFLDASSPEKALEWLKRKEKAGEALDNFFEKHGHRGFSEMDFGEPSWKINPTSFLPILRNILRNRLSLTGNGAATTATSGKVNKKPSAFKNDDELLDSLSSNLKPITREKSKSLFVRVIGQFKEKHKQLAELMVEEHLLPSESLIVHLTHFEIGQLVNKDASSSVILQKAMKRQKMYATVEKLEFPEICLGLPKELDTSSAVTVTDTIQATPVSRGIARGVAKVSMSVHEASENLHPGDILITHGTDIAWSPFFPILGGVVTELGGLISHGAVVAREYGLPCIVGAVNATKIFKTGDRVILDAGKGTLSKVDE